MNNKLGILTRCYYQTLIFVQYTPAAISYQHCTYHINIVHYNLYSRYLHVLVDLHQSSHANTQPKGVISHLYLFYRVLLLLSLQYRMSMLLDLFTGTMVYLPQYARVNPSLPMASGFRPCLVFKYTYRLAVHYGQSVYETIGSEV